MGTGILMRYSKQMLGGILAICAIIAAVLLCSRFCGPVGGPSPHETVNDLYEWEYMTFAAEQELYPADVEAIRLYFRNDAPDGVVCLATRTLFAYELEFLKDGVWHSMRAKVEQPRWWSDNDTEGAPGTDVVQWDGGEMTLYCGIARDYPTPVPAGRYRIIIPDCEHMQPTLVDLAVEFEVR